MEEKERANIHDVIDVNEVIELLETESDTLAEKNVSIMELWRRSLSRVLSLYDLYRPGQRYFVPKLFLFFVVTNISCYWLGISTAFPSLLFSDKVYEYVLLQFPVGIMGACFDTLSFFITIWIARNAIKSIKTWKFLLHLSLDLLLAFLATMWVVLVFVVSGWLLSFWIGSPEGLQDRSQVYQGRLLQALLYPFANIRNIYFGLIMGMSAALPSIIHLGLFFKALLDRAFQLFSSVPTSKEGVYEPSEVIAAEDSPGSNTKL